LETFEEEERDERRKAGKKEKRKEEREMREKGKERWCSDTMKVNEFLLRGSLY